MDSTLAGMSSLLSVMSNAGERDYTARLTGQLMAVGRCVWPAKPSAGSRLGTSRHRARLPLQSLRWPRRVLLRAPRSRRPRATYGRLHGSGPGPRQGPWRLLTRDWGGEPSPAGEGSPGLWARQSVTATPVISDCAGSLALV